MRYKYYYCQLYDPKLKDVLEKHKLHYQIYEGHITLIYFSIWSTSKNSKEIINELANISTNEPIITPEYTASEIANAELLWLMPKKQYVDILNTAEAYLSTCIYADFVGKRRVRHRQQRNIFVINKEPVIGKQTAFWAESTGFAEVFADYRVRELIEKNALSGIKIENVLLKNGTYSSKIFQLKAQQVIDKQCIGIGYGEKIEHCKYCGKEQFNIDTAYQLHLDFSKIDLSRDMYMTEHIFGEGIARPLYLISQRFYQLLKEAKLRGSLNISPVFSTSQENISIDTE